MHRTAKLVLTFSLLALTAQAGIDSKDNAYVGGTRNEFKQGDEGTLDTSGDAEAVFAVKKGATLRIPYNKISSLEYGQKVGRRVGVAIAVSPVALFSKKRRHYLSVGWTDADGKNQAVVLELGKDIVRPTLKVFEVRSGKQIEYESEEAKKHVGN
jgi:hypothetical protein